MQTTGYIKVHDEVVLVLVRAKKYSRLMRIRFSGQPGSYFSEEGKFFEEHPDSFRMLKEGKTFEL